MQQQITESSKELQVALVAVSTDLEVRGKSVLPDACLGGTLVGIIKHRGRRHQRHKEQSQQEDCRAAGGDSACMCSILYP